MGSFYKTLVVGVDFSDYSKLVVKQALHLGDQYGCQIVITHATTGTTQFLGSVAVQELTLRYSDTLKEAMPGHYRLSEREDIKYEIHYGFPEEVLVKTAKRYPDPLIMVGHRGHGRVGRFFLGSTAERLALHSPYPVWIQRGNSIVDVNKVLVPHDLSEHSDTAVNELESKFAHNRKALEMFFVKKNHTPVLDIDEWNKIEKRLAAIAQSGVRKIRAKHKGIKFFQTYGDPASEIAKRSKAFDITALTPRNRHSPFPALGSVTAKLVRTLNEPVLVLPSP